MRPTAVAAAFAVFAVCALPLSGAAHAADDDGAREGAEPEAYDGPDLNGVIDDRLPDQPPPPCLLVPVDLGVTPRWSINQVYRPTCASNYFTLSLGWNRAGHLHGLGIGLGATIADYDAWGLQIGVGAAIAGRHAHGLQLAGLISVAGHDGWGIAAGGLGAVAGRRFQGLQLGGLFAVAGEEGAGLQLGGLFVAGGKDFAGIQVGGLFAVAGQRGAGLQVGGAFAAAGEEYSGIQVGGLFAATGERLTGLQVGGAFVAAPALRGLQVGGGAAFVERGRGFQIAGGYARATRHLQGAQIAIVNWGGDVEGLQLGVVNVARRVRGVQLGVVNVADHASAPLGLVSWMRGPDARRVVEAFGGEAVPLTLAARLGTSSVYSLLGLGARPLGDDACRAWGPVGGFGVRALAGPIALLVDGLAYHLFFADLADQALLAQARLRAEIPVAGGLLVTAGASWNVFVSDDVDGADLPLGGDSVSTSGATTVRMWPGFTLGAGFAF